MLPDTLGKNLLQNPSFEAGLRNMAFRHFLMPTQNKKLWEIKPVRVCETDAKFGKKSLEIFSDSPKEHLAQKITTSSVALEKGVYTFSVWAKSDTDGQSLTVSLADAGKLYDRKNWRAKTFKLEREWRRFDFTFDVDAPQISPLVFEASSALPAVCRLDGMQLERGAEATDFEAPSADAFFESDFANNLIERGKPAGARLVAVAAPNAKGKIEAEIFDFFGERVFSEIFEFVCGADGVAKIPLAVEKLGRGLFVLKTRAAADGGSERYEISRFAVADFLENKHKHKNLFVDTYVDPLSTQQNFPEILAWYKKLGYGARAGYTNRDNLISREAKKYGIDSLNSPVGRITRDKQIGRAFVFLENTNWFSIPNMWWKKALLLDDFRRGGGDITPEYNRFGAAGKTPARRASVHLRHRARRKACDRPARADLACGLEVREHKIDERLQLRGVADGRDAFAIRVPHCAEHARQSSGSVGFSLRIEALCRHALFCIRRRRGQGGCRNLGVQKGVRQGNNAPARNVVCRAARNGAFRHHGA